MLVDLHCHTSPRSSCSRATLEGLAAAARARGVDGLCLTEHDLLWSEDDLAAASSSVGFPLMAGVELSTDVGHVLVYGELRRPLWQGYRFAELVDEAASTGAAVVLAHPVRRVAGERAARAGRAAPPASEVAASDAWRLAHGVEACSTQSTAAEHALTAEALAVVPKPAVAGSDAHDAHNAGAFATRFATPVRTAHDIAAAIRAGRVEPVRLSP